MLNWKIENNEITAIVRCIVHDIRMTFLIIVTKYGRNYKSEVTIYNPFNGTSLEETEDMGIVSDSLIEVLSKIEKSYKKIIDDIYDEDFLVEIRDEMRS